MSTVERLQMVFPCDRVASVAVGNRQHEIPWRIDSCDDEAVAYALDRTRRNENVRYAVR